MMFKMETHKYDLKGLHSNKPFSNWRSQFRPQLNFGISSTLKNNHLFCRGFMFVLECFKIFFQRTNCTVESLFQFSIQRTKIQFNWTNICKQTRGANFLIWTLGLLNSCRGPNSENFLRNIFTFIKIPQSLRSVTLIDLGFWKISYLGRWCLFCPEKSHISISHLIWFLPLYRVRGSLLRS